VRDQPNIPRSLKRVLLNAHEKAIDADLMRMNEKHHVVNMDGKTRVLTWKPNPIHRDRLDPIFSTFEDFCNLHNHHDKIVRVKERDSNGHPTGNLIPKKLRLGAWWLRQKGRRQYDGGIEYMPGVNADERGGTLNLFQGFAVKPVAGEGHTSYLEHLRINVCSGHQDWYDYLIRWMAHAVQFPDQRAEVGIVLIGKKGVGKTLGVEEFGKIFGQHFLVVVNPDHFTGKFNFHLQRCSVLLADECLYAGDRKHEQIAKAMVTGSTLFIEPKGLNAYQANNYLHIFICTNNDWAVPATEDERRWFCLNVGEAHRQDFDYFTKICADMKNGGRANLLHYLQNMDLGNFQIRKVPETDALKQQKALSRRGVEALVGEWCHDGVLPSSVSGDKPNVIITSGKQHGWGFDNWIETKAPMGLRAPGHIKNALKEKWGTKHFHSRINGTSVAGIEFPSLAQTRALFEKTYNNGEFMDWRAADVTEWQGSEIEIPF
jgi:hypothetical protein